MITLQDIMDWGIVGAGGAGFPAHIKLRQRPQLLFMNAAECEPLLHKDAEILRQHTDVVLKGFEAAIALTGARKAVIAIKKKQESLIRILKKKMSPSMQMLLLDDIYPAGDEITLIYEATGRVVRPGDLPVTVGCLVQNVETLYNIGNGKPVTHKMITVTGAVKEPRTLLVPIGTSIGVILSHFEITAQPFMVRSGGLMMGSVEKDPDAVVTKTMGGLIVLPLEHPAAHVYERYAEEKYTVRMAKAACDQCSLCTEICPRYLLGYPVRPELAMRNRMFAGDMKAVHAGNVFCCECALCTMVACPEGLDPRGSTVMEKKEILKEIRKGRNPEALPHPLYRYRKTPMRRVIQRLGVSEYDREALLSDLEIHPGRVRIPLRQHAGAPAVPVVEAGKCVRQGDLLAAANGDISASVHASMDGIIIRLDADAVTIQG